MKIFSLVLCLCLTVLGEDSGKSSFNSVVAPFLKKHCTDCHGAKKKKGDLRLHDISADLAGSKDLERWQSVLEQLVLGEMPPEKKARPDSNKLSGVIKWIDTELAKSGNVSDLAVKLKEPNYGNYINHEKLFSGDIKDPAWSPARLWRKSPDAFKYSKHFLFGKPRSMFWEPKTHFGGLDTKRPDPLPGVKQAFVIEDKNGFKDYASLLYADSATLGTLLRNAAFIADQALEGAVKELELREKNLTLKDWRRQMSDKNKLFQNKLREIVKKRNEASKKHGNKSEIYKTLSSEWQKMRNSWKMPQVRDSLREYRDVALYKGIPADELIKKALSVHFENIMHRKPSAAELSKYSGFMKKNIQEAGNVEALRLAMMAVMVSPEAVYRMELGLGKKDQFGRSILSPGELAFAVSLALTDGPPDDALFKAAKEGRLKTKDDVRREVVRILENDKIQKPRLLRFFHEYFGYHKAPGVFKDEKRFKAKQNGSYRVQQLVIDTDTLVKYIVKQDKNVLKELLTTDEYFVIHKGDNKKAKVESDAIAKFYSYFKDKGWNKFGGSFDEEHKKFTRGLNQPYFYKSHFFGHPEGRSVKRLMAYYDKCREKGITPVPVYSWGVKDLGPLVNYNLYVDNWSYAVKQPTKIGGKRVGILSHPSWLIAHSLNVENDPIRRGKWIRERLLGGIIPDVPITVDASIPEDPHKTLRERFAVTEKEECWRCHKKMNPLGYTFESFNDFGTYRESEELEHLPKVKGKYPVKPVNSKGFLEGTGDDKLDGPVADHVELMHKLAASEKVRQVFVRHAFRYWMGRNEILSDSQVLIAADKAYTENGGSFKSLIISLLTSDSFLYRKVLD